MQKKQRPRDRNHEIKIIFATSRSLGMDEDMLRDLNFVINKTRSIGDLDDAGRAKLMRELFAKKRMVRGGQDDRQRLPRGRKGYNVIRLISTAEESFIKDMLDKLGWTPNPKRYEGFCRRVIKQPAPRTQREAEKIIEALKDMVHRNYGQEAATS